MVAGKLQPSPTAGQYLALTRLWKPGDAIRLDLPMTPRLTVADHRVTEDNGKIAVERGPLVYCLEGLDQHVGAAQTEAPKVRDLKLNLAPTPPAFTESPAPAPLNGITVLEHPGTAAAIHPAPGPANPETTQAYAPLALSGTQPAAQPATLRFIPYFAWANRTPSTMAVWIPAEISPTRSALSEPAPQARPAAETA